jgi:hypothetical protein
MGDCVDVWYGMSYSASISSFEEAGASIEDCRALSVCIGLGEGGDCIPIGASAMLGLEGKVSDWRNCGRLAIIKSSPRIHLPHMLRRRWWG